MSTPTTRCPTCGTRLRVPPAPAGGRIRCPLCEERFVPTAVEPAREEDDEPNRAPRRGRGRGRPVRPAGAGTSNLPLALMIVGAVVLVVGGLGLGAYLLARPDKPDRADHPAPVAAAPVRVNPAPAAPAAPATKPPAVPAPPAAKAPSPEEIVRRVKASTVYIRTSFGEGLVGTGTGFFAGRPGHVVTNAHVLGYGPDHLRTPAGVEVVVAGGEAGERTLPAKVYGVDADADLAVLRVDAPGLPDPLPFGRAADLTETQEVAIFGYPFGEVLGKNISVNRTTVSSLRKAGGAVVLVQLAGGANPGNSGGPVTNAKGEVVGVTVATLRGAQAIAFAIPGEAADRFVAEQVRVGGRIDAGSLTLPPPTRITIERPPGEARFARVPEPEVTGPPVRLPPVTRVGIVPPAVPPGGKEVKLPAPVGSACLGGGGRYLVMHLPAARQLAILDLCRVQLMSPIPTTAEKLFFAAGMHKLAVVYPEANVIERWDLATRTKEASAPVPTKLGVCGLAMGSGSNGPVLVQAVDYPRLGERFLFDLTTMRAVEGTRTNGGVIGARPGNRLRAGPDGTVFTLSAPDGRASALVATDRGWVEYPCPLKAADRPVVPSGDGQKVLCGAEMATRTGTRVRAPSGADEGRVCYLPAAHGPFHLTLTEPPDDPGEGGGRVRVSVHTHDSPQTLLTLPRLPAVESLCEEGGKAPGFEGRVFYVPDADLVAVLPKAGDRVALYRVGLEAGLAKAVHHYLYVASRPPAAVAGKRFEYQLVVKSRRGGVRYKLAAGPPGMAVGDGGKVTWDVPAGFDRPAAVAVEVTDEGGRTVVHAFDLPPTTADPG